MGRTMSLTIGRRNTGIPADPDPRPQLRRRSHHATGQLETARAFSESILFRELNLARAAVGNSDPVGGQERPLRDIAESLSRS
jgi:hypothetical protein